MNFTTADFKAVMGRFTTGVTVVTTALGSQRAGITVNAFCSVSLDPPLVLVCIERTAHIHDLLIEAGVFAVNLLAEEQDELARCFAVSSDRRNTEFCDCETRSVQTGAPVLRDALGYLNCVITDVFPGGDHSIVVGRVEALGAADRKPLVYYRSQYTDLIPPGGRGV
ncbi:MAG TPA: flavin reductase family protein [Ktedonobacterales bacterium]|jgi:flavin reductase (DIM6/NTAB) family NADH-FMN oxidoreductase RutF